MALDAVVRAVKSEAAMIKMEAPAAPSVMAVICG
jgi:hypothetical protein